MNVSIIKHYDCHEIVNRLSTDCHAYPADCHHRAPRFRVSHFKSDHFSRSSLQIMGDAGFWWVFAAYGWVFRLACWVFLPYGWVFRLRNDKVNSLLLFGNRTKVTENIPLFGGPYRNSHRQFFYSPKKNAKHFVLVFFFRNLNFPKIQEVLTPPRDQILNEKVKKKI